MSLTYSAASADSASALSEPGCEQCSSSSSTRSAGPSSPNTGPTSPAMTTSAPFTLPLDLPTSSAEGFPAKTSATRERVRDWPEPGRDFGESTPVWLAKFDPDSSSWRTSQHCLVEGLEPFSETWPRSGMTRNGTAYRLPPLAHLTDATEYGSWPTPNAADNRPRATAYSTARRMRLGKQISLEAAVKFWPTPAARDYRDGGYPAEHARHTPSLAAQAGGTLNPTWVEWLMGFPLGWTVCEAWETRSSRRSRKSSAARS